MAASFLSKKVAVFGGSFDPITNGHLLVVSYVLRSGIVDELWLIPCGNREDKAIEASLHERLEMCQLAINTTVLWENRNAVKVKDTELSRYIPTYTLLENLQREHPTFEFWFLIGSDLLPNLPNWFQADNLMRNCKFIIHERPCFPVDDKYISNLETWINITEMLRQKGEKIELSDVSSSQVRKILSSRGTMEDCLMELPKAVLMYIKNSNLYYPRENLF